MAQHHIESMAKWRACRREIFLAALKEKIFISMRNGGGVQKCIASKKSGCGIMAHMA